jgi:hypothetical protein
LECDPSGTQRGFPSGTKLKNKSIDLVKVKWTCYGPELFTWEHEEVMREAYPQSFENFEEK